MTMTIVAVMVQDTNFYKEGIHVLNNGRSQGINVGGEYAEN